LGNLSRGRHTVEALVVNDAGKVLIRIGAVDFNVRRAAVGGG
jgi:L-asparaginase II